MSEKPLRFAACPTRTGAIKKKKGIASNGAGARHLDPLGAFVWYYTRMAAGASQSRRALMIECVSAFALATTAGARGGTGVCSSTRGEPCAPSCLRRSRAPIRVEPPRARPDNAFPFSSVAYFPGFRMRFPRRPMNSAHPACAREEMSRSRGRGAGLPHGDADADRRGRPRRRPHAPARRGAGEHHPGAVVDLTTGAITDLPARFSEPPPPVVRVECRGVCTRGPLAYPRTAPCTPTEIARGPAGGRFRVVATSHAGPSRRGWKNRTSPPPGSPRSRRRIHASAAAGRRSAACCTCCPACSSWSPRSPS